MPMLNEFWDPNEWESHVYALLQDRHGATNVMKVPARHKGDHGIDYYCLGARVAYQCYAVQEPCEIARRAERQKAKITTDLKKLRLNADKLQGIFGTVKINRWVLVVPLHDSADVNRHLSAKSREVLGYNLPFVEADFEALIQDLEAFNAEAVAERALQRRTISLPDRPPTSQQIVEWSSASDVLVSRMSEKMRKRTSVVSDAEIDELVNRAVEWFLERENALDALRADAPQLYETLVGVIARRTERLCLYGPPQSGEAGEILRTELESLQAELKNSVPHFADKSAEQLALGTVADWLMRCPLDFPPYSHV